MLTAILVTTASHSGESLRNAIVTAKADAKRGTSDTVTFASSLNGATIILPQQLLELGLGSVGSGTTTIVGGCQMTVSGGNTTRVFQVEAGLHVWHLGTAAQCRMICREWEMSAGRYEQAAHHSLCHDRDRTSMRGGCLRTKEAFRRLGAPNFGSLNDEDNVSYSG